MQTYRNDKGATITTACKITGGGWEPISGAGKAETDTRTEKAKQPRIKRNKDE